MKKIYLLITILAILSVGCSIEKNIEIQDEEETQATTEEAVEANNESQPEKEEQKEPEKNVELPAKKNNPYMYNEPLDSDAVNFVEGIVDGASISNYYVLEKVDKTSLINKYNRLPSGWEPKEVELITSNSSRSIYLEKEAAQAYEKMRVAAEKEGIRFVVFSGYRSASGQHSLYNQYYQSDALDAIQYSAYPRSSEHEAGYALDIGYNEDYPENFYETEQGKFLDQHAHEYGFVLRYPLGKESITGYNYESWHYRYVGTELAKILKQNDQTLEEYYGVLAEDKPTETKEEKTEEQKQVPNEEPSVKNQIRIDNDYLNVRAEPSTESELLGEIYMDEVYTYYLYADGWYQIDFNGQKAWVYGIYVQEVYE